MQTATEVIQFEIVQEINWSSIKPRDNLVLLYPRAEIPTSNVMRFVSDGGDLMPPMITVHRPTFSLP